MRCSNWVMQSLLTPAAHSFAEFSMHPSFRRRWPMLYEALQDGVIYRTLLLDLYCMQIPRTERPLLAGDHTAWSRLHAHTLSERTVEHQPNAIPNAKPITVGQGYSTIVWLPETPGSWALPCLHERIAPTENPIGKIVTQLRQVCQRLSQRPLALFDAEYGCAPFVKVPISRAIKLCACARICVCAVRPHPTRAKAVPPCMGPS